MEPDPATRDAKGKRGLLQTLVRIAEVKPDRVFGSFPLTSNVEDGFRDITFAECAKAVDACAWFIKDTFGTSDTFETLLYMGVSDHRYMLVMFAAIKCGFKALFVSPRNPVWQNLLLLEKTACSKALFSSELADVVSSFQAEKPALRSVELKPFPEWLAEESRPFPYNKTSKEAEWDPVVVLHSSGSTGPPKPITIPGGYFKSADVPQRAIDGYKPILMDCFDFEDGGFVFGQFPAYHLSGLILMSVLPMHSFESAGLISPPDTDPTQSAEVALRILSLKRVKAVNASPLLITQLSKLPGGMDAMKRLEMVSFVGGPLSSPVGDALEAAGVKITQVYGSTECGSTPLLLPAPGEWEWMHIHPDCNPSWEPSVDGAYELVFKDDPDVNHLRGTYWTLREKEFRTKDMFIPHPTKANHWKFHGRTDDNLLFSIGNKINPVNMEGTITGHPKVAGAHVTGVNRWPASLLVEPREHVEDRRRFIEEIWPQVEKANALVQHWARVLKPMIAVVEPNSFVRVPKGTLMRNRNAEAHAQTIDKLYEEYEKGEKGTQTW